MFAIAFVITLIASAEVRVVNCVNGEDTLVPAEFVEQTIERWRASADFAGVLVGANEDDLDVEVHEFLKARTFLGREMILIQTEDPGRVVQPRGPGLACLVRSGLPRRRI